MKPNTFSYTFDALDADGFCDDVTGDISAAAWTTLNSALTDGCAHQTTLASGANLSGITITLTGTDAEGRTQTESIAGPNNETINCTKKFASITSVSADATLGANTMDVGWTAVAVTPTFPVDYYAAGPLVSCDIGGTINYTVQATNSNVFSDTTPSWIAAASAATADSLTACNAGVTAVRVLINSHTSGTLELTISQALT